MTLTLLMLLPLLGAVLVSLMGKSQIEATKKLALASSLLTFLATLLLFLDFDSGTSGLQLAEKYSWIPSLGINFQLGVDGISISLIALSTALVPLVILGGWNEAEGGKFSVKTFYVLILVLEAMMIGVFAATDLFLFYLFFEAMLIPVYFLIGGYGVGARQAAAIKFLLYSLFGGLLMLAAVIGVYVISRNQIGATFDIEELATLQIDSTTQNFLFLGFFIAFAIKAPLWPFHTWLPDAAKSATPGTSILLLGVLDKVGTFGMIRFCVELFPEASKTFAPTIIAFSLISIIYGAILAIGQKDIKGLIAFTSISHFGFIIMGIFALTTQGNSGATLYMVSHGLSTAALFLTAGWMISRRGSSTISDFGGLQRVTPVLAWTFFFAGMSSLALPGLSSFVSEFLVLVGTYTRYPAAAVIGTIGIILAALYILIPVQRALHGATTPGNESLTDLNRREKIAIAPIILLIILLGIYPKPALDLINPAAKATIERVGLTDPAPAVTEGGK